jgi:hypothetical protein
MYVCARGILFDFLFSWVKIVIKIIVHFSIRVKISASVCTDKAASGFDFQTFFLNFLKMSAENCYYNIVSYYFSVLHIYICLCPITL